MENIAQRPKKIKRKISPTDGRPRNGVILHQERKATTIFVLPKLKEDLNLTT